MNVIGDLWDREGALLRELHLLPEPLSRAPDLKTAFEQIERREAIKRELEAVRAVKHELTAQEKDAAARQSEIEHQQESIAELERRLPAAIAADAKEGSEAPNPSREEQVRTSLARRREELGRLEDGGELPQGNRITLR